MGPFARSPFSLARGERGLRYLVQLLCLAGVLVSRAGRQPASLGPSPVLRSGLGVLLLMTLVGCA